MEQTHVSGYTFGRPGVPRSPVSLEELSLLRATIGFTEEDERYLRRAGEILATQVDAFLDRWYAFTSMLPHLSRYSESPNGEPLLEYRAASRRRFRQWLLDMCNQPYDQDWLDYQYEVGLRHHRTKKNRTDDVLSADNVSFRYILAQTYPMSTMIGDFLAQPGDSAEDRDKMHQAWTKSLLLHVILWSYPYLRPGDF